MKSKFTDLEITGRIKPTPLVSIHYDNQTAIVITKNKTHNGKNKHIQLRHNGIKQLLKDGTISINYLNSKGNLLKKKLLLNTVQLKNKLQIFLQNH
ncbi:hypothetical protein CR513_14734, partial [Mucuna pruriens]